MLELNESTFEKALTNSKTLVIDFGAIWCPPCRTLATLYNKWSVDHADKATFAKVDIDEASGLASKMNISAVPTILVFKEGKESKRFLGLITEGELLKALV